MATIAQKTTSNPLAAVWAPIWRVMRAVGNFLVLIGESNRHVREIERLQALSDEQLAARGLKREDIVRHVIGGSYYI